MDELIAQSNFTILGKEKFLSTARVLVSLPCPQSHAFFKSSLLLIPVYR